MIVVAFTGTRSGATSQQKAGIHRILASEPGGTRIFRHGAAKGADIEAHWIAVDLDWKVHAYPSPGSDVDRVRSTSEYVEEPMAPLTRNKVIVNGADMLIACPWGETPTRYPNGNAKGGTWSTVDYALTTSVTTMVVFPDGDVLQPPTGARYGRHDDPKPVRPQS